MGDLQYVNRESMCAVYGKKKVSGRKSGVYLVLTLMEYWALIFRHDTVSLLLNASWGALLGAR